MNIMVIRRDAMGDALVTLPILIALRKKYAHANPHITYVANAAVMPLAKAWGLADEVFDFTEQWDLFLIGEKVRKPIFVDALRRTDLAILFFYDPTGVITRSLRAAGVKQVYIPPLGPPEERDLMPDQITKHMVEQFAAMVDVPAVKPEEFVLPNTGPEPVRLAMPPVALHPGSRAPAVRWPTTSFAALSDQLLRRGYPVLVLIGPTDQKLEKIMRRNLQTKPARDMFTVLKNAPVLEVAARLKQCGCFVGHNTGLSHLAALVRIPTVALFGQTYPNLWRPLGPTVEVIHVQSLEQLPVERVLESVLRMYDSHHPHS